MKRSRKSNGNCQMPVTSGQPTSRHTPWLNPTVLSCEHFKRLAAILIVSTIGGADDMCGVAITALPDPDEDDSLYFHPSCKPCREHPRMLYIRAMKGGSPRLGLSVLSPVIGFVVAH